jgi:hypothetical protein
MTRPTASTRFRRGWSVEKRQEYRAFLREQETEKAVRRAEKLHLSGTCINAMAATGGADPDYARALHQACRGELPGGIGCLCRCHDVIQAEVEAGFATGTVALPDQLI